MGTNSTTSERGPASLADEPPAAPKRAQLTRSATTSTEASTTATANDRNSTALERPPPASRAQSMPRLIASVTAHHANTTNGASTVVTMPTSTSHNSTSATQGLVWPVSSSTRSSLPPSFSTTGSGVGRRGGKPRPASAIVLDRRLLQKYEHVNHEIDRIVRASQMDNPENSSMLQQVRAELRKVKRSSSAMIQSQKELLDKMDKQERSGIRRLFSINRQGKMEKLKLKLCDKLSESVKVDEELMRLERKSSMLSRTSFDASSNNFNPVDAAEELLQLEREKQDILNNLFSAIDMPDVHELNSRIAMYSSEMKACESIHKQVERTAELYRQALHLVRVSLAAVVSPHYSGTLKEFVQGPYPMAVEASHLIEAASHAIQPESRRRYAQFAPELSSVHMPKFPQAITDFARRARANFDPHSALSMEGMRKLRNAENVIMLMQRVVIEKLEVIEAWKIQVEKDLSQAETNHQKLEARLEEQMAVLARSVSV